MQEEMLFVILPALQRHFYTVYTFLHNVWAGFCQSTTVKQVCEILWRSNLAYVTKYV